MTGETSEPDNSEVQTSWLDLELPSIEPRSPYHTPDPNRTAPPADAPSSSAGTVACPDDTPPVLPERAALLTSLMTAAASLTGIRTTNRLLAQTVTATLQALPQFNSATIWLLHHRTRKLHLAASTGLEQCLDVISELQSVHVRVGETRIGQAVNQSDVIIDRTVSEQHISDQIARNWGSNLLAVWQPAAVHHDICYVPITVGDHPLGVLTIARSYPMHPDEDDLHAHPLNDADVALLRDVLPIYASLLAQMIEVHQRYDQERRHRDRLDAFDAVVTAISTATDLKDMLASVLRVIISLTHVESGAIFLLDPVTDQVSLGASEDLPPNYAASAQAMPVAGAMCEEVLRYGQPMLRPLIEERGEGMLLEHGLDNCAYIPLLAGGTVVGTLALYSSAELIHDLDISRLMPLGNQIGFAIANVRLYQDSSLERYKLTTVINSIADGIVLCDSSGRLVLANEAAVQLLSLNDLVAGQPLDITHDFHAVTNLEGEVLHPEQFPLTRALAGETFHNYRILLRDTTQQEMVLSFSGAPVQADTAIPEGAVIVFRDTTALYRQERAKDDFLASTAHELRAPLAAVRSYAELLLRREQKRTEGDARDMRGLTILAQQVGHMLQMVDNLLDVSRLDAGQVDLQLQAVNLLLIGGQVIDQQRPAAGDRELLLDSSDPEVWVRCDAMRVRQVMTNLISNAMKYSPPDSPVRLRIERRNDPQPMAVVCVTDRGDGLSPEQQQRLFQRFTRFKSRRAEGLGLGLYLSREFVQRHGGTIWVESEPGEGSSFCFTLPISNEE